MLGIVLGLELDNCVSGEVEQEEKFRAITTIITRSIQVNFLPNSNSADHKLLLLNFVTTYRWIVEFYRERIAN